MKQELQPLVIGEEQELRAAIAAPRIKDLQNEEYLKEALRQVMVMVGLRASNWPKDEEKGLLLAFIRENYGGHTPSEIILAFKMAISGKLDLDKSEVVCYENFSVLYFSGIMNAYREWSKQAVFHIQKPQRLIENKVEVSDAEFLNSVLLIYKANRKASTIPALAYDILLRNKIVEDRSCVVALFTNMINKGESF